MARIDKVLALFQTNTRLSLTYKQAFQSAQSVTQ